MHHTISPLFRSYSCNIIQGQQLLYCLLRFNRIERYDRSLPLSLTTCPYFCNLVMSWSPTLTTS